MDFSKHLQKAEEATRRRQWDFAIEVYQQLLNLDADLAEARGGLRRAQKRKFEEQKTGKLFRAAFGAMPLGAAKALLKTKRYDAAAKQLESYLASNPLDVDGNLMLGLALEGAGFFKSARAVYEFLAEIAPGHAEGLKRAGAMMQKAGDVPKALEYYERALKADPRDQEALKARKDLAAEAALKKGGYEGASHSRDLLKDKDRTQSLERERRRHMTEDEMRAEVERMTARFAEASTDVDLMTQIAELHEKLGDYEAAAEFVDRALSYRKDSFELAAKAGDLQAKALKKAMARADKAGDAEKAAQLERELCAHEVRDWRRRVALRPNELALRFEFGKRLMRSGELDLALGEFQKVLPEPRLQRDVRFWLGQCFQAKGFGELAKKEYSKALEGSSEVDERAKEILYNLGAIAEAEGDSGSARGHYTRVYEIDIGYRDVAAKMERLK
ncbi:MAG: tetratricopeptide repeat protein [Planctomycetes bacterium]|nr:tetratricopeptide repeat protein [Planctomycetota bacterium]